MDSFLDAVKETNAWGVVEETMVPYLIKAIGLKPENEQQNGVYRQTGEDSSFKYFPLVTACHILASTLDACVKGKPVSESRSGSILANGCSVHMFAGNLVWDICNVTLQMLSHSVEHRSCAITIFLPHILKAFLSENAFQILVNGQNFMLSRYTHFQTTFCLYNYKP